MGRPAKSAEMRTGHMTKSEREGREIAQNAVSLKDLRKGEQVVVSADAAADMILDDMADNLTGTILK